MRIYLSGRMSGLEARVWRQRFWLAAFGVWRRMGDGVWVVNPADLFVCRHLWAYRLMERVLGAGRCYRLVLWYDLRLLRRCDAIVMVADDWRTSRGARLERMKARQWNLRFLTTTDFTDITD